jgi:hypothetical protein
MSSSRDRVSPRRSYEMIDKCTKFEQVLKGKTGLGNDLN